MGAVAACGLINGDVPQAPASTSSARLPPDWPSTVPAYPKGTLFTAYTSADGTAVASWEVPSASAADVRGQYERMLTRRGFRRFEWYSSNGETGFRYVGHGLVVTVGTIEVHGQTSLDVAVAPR